MAGQWRKTIMAGKKSVDNLLSSKKDITVNMPPFELMGKMFAEQMRTFAVEHQAFLAECRADLAEAKSDRLMLVQSIRELMATVKDGKDGIDGKDGRDGIDGKDGAPGEKGEKGEQGEKGEAGEKGEPGILSAEAIADAYQGIWSEGVEYLRGQIVTWGGSLWLALAKNVDKPGEQNDNWKLIVKRGRDGKDGKNGDPGPEGKQGPKGEKGERGYNA